MELEFIPKRLASLSALKAILPLSEELRQKAIDESFAQLHSH